MAIEKKAPLGGPFRWLEKRKIIWQRLLDDFRKRKAEKKKAHLVVKIRRLEKRKLTW
jgi:hypothetical protein